MRTIIVKMQVQITAILCGLGSGAPSPIPNSTRDEVLQLTGFGAELSPSLLPALWDTEGIYFPNHSASVSHWRHSSRPLLLTYEPMIAGPLEPRRWLILDVGDDEDLLTGDRPIAELSAGAQPWEGPAGGWRTRDCLGGLRETDAELRAVPSRRQWDDCSTLTWRLTGLGEHHPRLALLAGQFQVTNEYSSGAPVYRAADTSAVLQRVVSGSRSSWVLHSPRDNETQMAALGEYADRINLIRTERFVASGLPGQDFLDQPAFVCHPEEWEMGDADFTLPDLDGYKVTDDIHDQAQWSRQRFTEEDSGAYARAFGTQPEEHARMLVTTSITRTRMDLIMLSITSPRISLTDQGCAIIRLHNKGFQLSVSFLRDSGHHEDLLETGSISGWRDVVVSLTGSGQMTLTASDPDGPSSRLAVTQILVFNETCDQLQGRTSACDEDTCFNGGTCTSVTLKHHLCLCPPGFLGPRCEDRVDCGEPDVIAFGQATRVSGNAYLDRAYYTCSPGYAPSETVLGVSWSVCHRNGSWVNTPRCEPLAGQAYLKCDFAAECADFNMRLDNEYNTDTDQEWERSERLRTSDIRPQGVFLTTYRARGQRTLTSRLRTPCLDLQASGCLQLDAYLSNATLTVMDWRTNRVLFRTEEGGRRLLVPLHPQAGPLLVVAQLEPGESEAALDSIRVYQYTCDQLLKVTLAEPRPWPRWPPAGQTDRSPVLVSVSEETETSTGEAAPILLVLVPLVVLLGIVMVLGSSRD
ncbi:uncharacterized protein LOC122379648 [Amphibalanus amphitrite]|uniref:uncharacterized protein LOC122366952 n=1 Tax=Amphibalanus amphitrite TaxID=1232801 RepID=UPI001C901713|nr:uncharacterized protein LOC122366952 [Amphibalanus amphitrite]XP_043217943.1 uncharacterized protein LOC122379648 [Amphibalanus amphitrite]XP_043217944.1 uncharacterized protein LOC122379648 [Amphibalanus amphitrite]